MVTKKVSLIGKPSMGKTTIKKVIFEGEDPNELVLFPLEATIGIKYSVHQFMDSRVSLIDAPGQSLPIIFQDEQKQILAFGDAGAIIYVFDYPTWISDSQDIIDELAGVEKGKGLQKGIEITARFIKTIKEENICYGVHIMAVGNEGIVPEIIEAAELTVVSS